MKPLGHYWGELLQKKKFPPAFEKFKLLGLPQFFFHCLGKTNSIGKSENFNLNPQVCV